MKKNYIWLLVNLITTSLFAQEVALEWARQLGGSDTDRGTSIAVDASGNVYTTGYFQGFASFDPTNGSVSFIADGPWDIFVSKLDASGNFVWAKQLGGTGEDRGHSIAVDALGNVYTTGYFGPYADFDPGLDTVNLPYAGNRDIFISKLDASGNFVWAKQFGGASFDYGNSIAVDALGNVYTTGYFSDTVDFDPGAGTFNLTSTTSDIFVSKLNASGNFVWAKQFGSADGYDHGNSIVADASGNVYTTGYFANTADFDPGAGTANLTSVNGDDIFISKLDALGNFVWAKQFGGTGFDYGSSIAVDSSDNVYTTGYFNDTIDFDLGSGTAELISLGSDDIFISKLDASGNLIWVKQFGSRFEDRGISTALDAFGNIYTTGYFKDTIDFDPGPGTVELISTRADDIFISKLDASGNLIWVKQLAGYQERGSSIVVDAIGNIYTTGEFSGMVDFDPGPDSVYLSTPIGSDIFVHKLQVSGVGITENNFGSMFKYFPNPTDEKLHIELGVVYPNVTVIVKNLLGQKVKHINSLRADKIEVTLDSEAGIYFIEVYTPEGKAASIKVMKN